MKQRYNKTATVINVVINIDNATLAPPPCSDSQKQLRRDSNRD